MKFRFIQISDTHLCIQPLRSNATLLKRRKPSTGLDTLKNQFLLDANGLRPLFRFPASYIPEIIEGSARFCGDRAAIVDAIIFTGDICTTGMPLDLQVAKSFAIDYVASGYRSASGFPSIKRANLPIYILPGNHDRYADNFGTSNCANFDILFESQRRNENKRVSHYLVAKNGIHIAFVAGDFCLRNNDDADDSLFDKMAAHIPGPVGRGNLYGRGKVYQDTLDEMCARTASLRSRFFNIHVVWAVHFAPYDCGGFLQLIDHANYIDAASRLGVAFTLCGYTHDNSKHEMKGHTVYCAGSCGCVDSFEKSFIHVIEIDANERSIIHLRENYIWDRRISDFRLDSVYK